MNISFDKKFIFFLLICLIIYFQGILRLPVMDRDEARFATASKTMLIDGDYIDIKMVDEKRYKKPIGIYWSQAFANSIFGSYPFDKIWIYRLPSLSGIFICLLLIFLFIKKIENSNVALLTVFFLVSSILTISEAHQSKTDGLLFLFISLCNLIIYKFIHTKKINTYEKVVYWISLAIGILIKGPIIIVFTILPLSLFSFIKKINYLRSIWSTFGFILFICISVPWFVLINIKSGGLFWYESVGNDLLEKVKSGKESHGFPPGYYSLLIFLFFWPGCLFLFNLVNNIKSNFMKIVRNDGFSFYLILSFLFPFILFELIPTKLPHYIYPAYLPLSILISKHIFNNDFNPRIMNYATIPLLIFPITIILLLIFSTIEFSKVDLNFIIIISCFIFFTFFLFWLRIKEKVRHIIIASGSFQALTYLVLIFFLIPRLESLWISEKINNTILKHEKGIDKVFTIGFNEPSLLFLTSHKSSNSFENFDTSKIIEKKILLIVTEKFNKNIREDEDFSSFILIDQFVGFNYSRGEDVSFKVYKN